MKNTTKLKKMRLLCNLKATELAKKLNLTRAAVYDTELRGLKQVETAKRYAKALGCSPAELLEF